MPLSQSPSELSIAQEEVKLATDAQARVEAVSKNAISILNENPSAQEALRVTFHNMIAGNLRDPINIGKIQNGLYEARDVRLNEAKPSEKLSILQSFSRFMEGFTENIAHMQRDINWSNEVKTLTLASDTKMSQVKNTYAQILANNHPTQTV